MKPLNQYQPTAAPIVPWECAEQGEWEMNVLLALCNALGIGSSDAIDLIGPWPHFMRDAWAERLDPDTAAAMLNKLSTGETQ